MRVWVLDAIVSPAFNLRSKYRFVADADAVFFFRSYLLRMLAREVVGDTNDLPDGGNARDEL